jgi:hypothetical protein
MTSFTPMVDALFAGPLAEPASYKADEDTDAIAIRVMPRRPDDALPVFRAEAVVDSLVVDVRQADVPLPVTGALVTIGSRSGTLRSWRSDPDGLIWFFNLDPQ